MSAGRAAAFARSDHARDVRRAAAGVNLVLLASSCTPWVGPVHLRIETGGARHDDFVIHPVKQYDRAERTKEEWLEPQVVSSEVDVTVPRSGRGPTFTTVLVYVYHPEFVTTFGGESAGGEIVLRPIRPVRWTDHIDAHGGVSVTTVRMHLKRMRDNWIPAFEPGAARERLRRYLPALEELAGRATLHPEDAGRWATEEAARRDLDEDLRLLAEMMR